DYYCYSTSNSGYHGFF
nr:immunoglobulin light chain junction region [Macaca mulatta]